MTVSQLKIQSCLAVLLLAGCASVPPPSAALAETEARIALAREQRAARYVPADLDAAEATAQVAREAMASKDYALAQQLAAESLALADLAIAGAREAALREQVRAKAEENRQLRRQLGLRGEK